MSSPIGKDIDNGYLVLTGVFKVLTLELRLGYLGITCEREER
jgi:hypothetical protein